MQFHLWHRSMPPKSLHYLINGTNEPETHYQTLEISCCSTVLKVSTAQVSRVPDALGGPSTSGAGIGEGCRLDPMSLS